MTNDDNLPILLFLAVLFWHTVNILSTYLEFSILELKYAFAVVEERHYV